MVRPALSGLKVTIAILEGRDLIAKDRNIFGKRTTSDTYVQVYYKSSDGDQHNIKYLGKTNTVAMTLSPVWDSQNVFSLTLGADSAQNVMKKHHANGNHAGGTFFLKLLDRDVMSDPDPMGTVTVPVDVAAFLEEDYDSSPKWYPVETGSGDSFCKNAKGEVLVRISLQAQAMRDLVPGEQTPISTTSHEICVGLAWSPNITTLEQDSGNHENHNGHIDLDCSCIAVGYRGEILMDETVYYGNLANSNRSVVHSGDETTGRADGDDEQITLKLDKIPPKVMAMYFLLTVANNNQNSHTNLTFANVWSAQARFIDTETRLGKLRVVPTDFGANTALFLLRLSRRDSNGSFGGTGGGTGTGDWLLTPIEQGDPYARDFGSLIPEIKGYTRDLVPDIYIDPKERIAVMRKGGTIRISDYVPSGSIPKNVTFGLAWDVTNGVNIDLDASAILLDKDLQLVEIVCFNHLTSSDGSIRHGGDEREGDEQGDDEKINLCLGDVSPHIKYIGFVVNSYSKQELDDIARASCHLFDPATNKDIATFTLSNSKELDKHTALVMGCLYRDDDNGGGGGGPNDWLLRIIAEPRQGSMAKDNVEDLQNFLRHNPPQPPSIVPEPDIVLTAMPDAVLVVEEEEIVYVPESELHKYVDEEIVVPPTSK
jgi:tellurium resistance protein TerZ